jgi:hypothetical protein
MGAYFAGMEPAKSLELVLEQVLEHWRDEAGRTVHYLG